MALLSLVFGLFLGSFFNVIVDRLYREEKFLTGRSYCESCKKTLQWYDLVPLISFLSTKGRCRYCRVKLSWYYPLSELGTGILFLLTEIFLGSSPLSLLYYFFIVSCLIIIFLMDAKYGLIPFVIVLPATFIVLIWQIMNHSLSPINFLLSGLGSFLFLFLIFAGTKGRGMGFGDVVFAGFMGLFLGFPLIILAHYIAFLTGAVVSSILVLLKRKKFKGSTIPFGPFLVLGTYICLLWGDKIVQVINKLLI